MESEASSAATDDTSCEEVALHSSSGRSGSRWEAKDDPNQAGLPNPADEGVELWGPQRRARARSGMDEHAHGDQTGKGAREAAKRSAHGEQHQPGEGRDCAL